MKVLEAPIKMVLVTLATVAMASSMALAQQKAPAEANTFAKKVAAANTFEIQSSQLAKDRTQSGELRSFAQQMISDHTKAGEDFKSAVSAAKVSPPPPERPDARQQLTLAKLRNAQGSAFDKAYVAAQLKAHEQAVTLFRRYSKNGHTAPLKEFATKTLPTLEHHLQMIQAISKKGNLASRS
jgi:putative membrane protein